MSSLHRTGQLVRLRRFNESFREKRGRFGESFRDQRRALQLRVIENRMRLRRIQRMPKWLRFMKKIYHEYGLKHILLFMVLIAYQFLGAGLFYLLEAHAEENRDLDWRLEIIQNRTRFIQRIIPSMFNNSDYLMFLNADQTDQIYEMLEQNLIRYEIQLGIKFSDQKIHWDFFNAMLYAGTVCTTIGYGHLYPSTTEGRAFTMIYAIFGIPLVLSILDDLGKLLTKIMKYPWALFKMGCRRTFRYCTNQSMEEIKRLDQEDRDNLETFDLPIPVAVFIVVAWIFVCSATFCVWEDWDYFVAFYFFFISLSTIGLGDIVPEKPKYLLMLFGYIIIGLSLVSMCVNLIQAKLEQTYDSGREDLLEHRRGGVASPTDPGAISTLRRRPSVRLRTTLGVFQTHGSNSSLASQPTTASSSAALPSGNGANKMCQTLLSFPSPSDKPKSSAFRNLIKDPKSKLIPTSYSIDDVMRLVDTEEDDVIILSELSNQYGSGNFSNDFNTTAQSRKVLSNSDLELSDDASPLLPTHSLQEIEEMEALEDRLLLGARDPYGNNVSSSDEESFVFRGLKASGGTAALIAPAVVHFRSRPSIIESSSSSDSAARTSRESILTPPDNTNRSSIAGPSGTSIRRPHRGGVSTDSIQLLDSLPEDEEVHSKTLPRSYSHI